jgi:hypothetical protein
MRPGVGNGAVPDWETVKAIWDALDFVLGVIGATTTLNEVRKRVADRLRRKVKRASQTIERHSGDWESRRGDPVALNQWLADRVWSSADVASALGCSEAEAEAVLWSFGFEHSASCVWRRGTDEEAKFINEVHGLGYATHGASREQVRHCSKSTPGSSSRLAAPPRSAGGIFRACIPLGWFGRQRVPRPGSSVCGTG